MLLNWYFKSIFWKLFNFEIPQRMYVPGYYVQRILCPVQYIVTGMNVKNVSKLIQNIFLPYISM